MRDMRNDPLLLSGTVPGVLDPSQPSRLLRTPRTTLFFAAFDPLTARASGFPNLSSLHIDPGQARKHVIPETVASSNGKRIVVEIDPENSTFSWRFVPRAKTERVLLGDEGSFPRLVELCGQTVRMTQDQWDLYKLDPVYDCVVRAHPNLTTITRVTSHKDTVDSDNTFISGFPNTRKRTPAPQAEYTPSKERQGSPPACSDAECPRNKRYKSTGIKRTVSSQTDSMSVDEDPSYIHNQTDQLKDHDFINRKKRRRSPDHLGGSNIREAQNLKRTAQRHKNAYLSHQHSSSRGINDISNNELPAKKIRTRSPSAVRRELEQKRIRRKKKRKAHMEARLKLRRDLLNRAFWNGLGVPPGLHNPGLYENVNDLADSEESESSDDESDDESSSHSDSTDGEDEAQRSARIEESRRKLAELEKDKPLWEENLKRRQAREKAEEEMRQRAKVAREEEERQRRHAQAARQQREKKWEKEREENEREARKRERSRRMFVPPRPRVLWTSRHALDRYLETAASFDVAKFSVGTTSVTFATIPWPVLDSSFSVQDIEWDAVERFFGGVRRLLGNAEFKDLVEKSQRRFHPDRWRSRGVLLSVKDDVERDLLEVAGSTVAQAITPLWKKVTGR